MLCGFYDVYSESGVPQFVCTKYWHPFTPWNLVLISKKNTKETHWGADIEESRNAAHLLVANNRTRDEMSQFRLFLLFL